MFLPWSGHLGAVITSPSRPRVKGRSLSARYSVSKVLSRSMAFSIQTFDRLYRAVFEASLIKVGEV